MPVALAACVAKGSLMLRGTLPRAARCTTESTPDIAEVSASRSSTVALDEGDVEPVEVVGEAGGEVVEDRDLVPCLEGELGEVRADEAGSPRDQHMHALFLARRRRRTRWEGGANCRGHVSRPSRDRE